MRKFTIILLAAIFALGTTACGDGVSERKPLAPPTVTVTGPAVTVTKPAPTVTKKVVKRLPAVTKTKTVTVYRKKVRTPVPQPTSTTAHSAPGGIAACIRKYESGGNYQAQNPSSSASGAYQFLDSTWTAVTGLPGSAKNYSPSTQDAAFFELWNNGAGAHNWVTAHLCGY